jgi:hypothetical protein
MVDFIIQNLYKIVISKTLDYKVEMNCSLLNINPLTILVSAYSLGTSIISPIDYYL